MMSRSVLDHVQPAEVWYLSLDKNLGGRYILPRLETISADEVVPLALECGGAWGHYRVDTPDLLQVDANAPH